MLGGERAPGCPSCYGYAPGCGISWNFSLNWMAGLGGTVLEASQAARIDTQQLGDERHVAGVRRGARARSSPTMHQRAGCRSAEPTGGAAARARGVGIDAIADRLAIVHEGARIVLRLVHQC